MGTSLTFNRYMSFLCPRSIVLAHVLFKKDRVYGRGSPCNDLAVL